MHNVFKCYFKTCDHKFDESVEYYYNTEENYNTIQGKYFNLINTYEPNIFNHDVLVDCMQRWSD